MVAKVLVDIKAKAVDKPYDYLLPSLWEDILEVGMRVIVGFGSREVMGYVLDIVDTSERSESELKPILSILDLIPMLTKELIQIAYQIQTETATPLIQVIEAMTPSALKAVYRVTFERIASSQEDPFVSSWFGSKTIKTVSSKEITEEDWKRLKRSVQAGLIHQQYVVQSRSRIKSIKHVKLLETNPHVRTAAQQRVVSYLQSISEPVSLQDLLKETSVSPSVLDTLKKNLVIDVLELETYRDPIMKYPRERKHVVLNDEQQSAFDQVVSAFGTSQTFLLHGVTGSGKTEIYLRLIDEALSKNLTALFLVPEISLTPMMVDRLTHLFGNQVAVLHSGLSIGEKYDEWRKILRGEAKVILGARSACFAPIQNLGIILVDECHESSYKQDETPNYYAIDVLQSRSITHRAPLVLGSATPNIESYARFRRGHYRLLELRHKALNSFPPEVEIIDMRNEVKTGNTALLSARLRDEIHLRLEKKEQTILLLNRRGYANFVLCRSCGHVIECPDCDISLTYHEADHSLKCHYCGHKENVPEECPVCHKKELSFMGSGTQRIETELKTTFPNAVLVRMDNDTTRTKNAHEELLHRFETEGDILLGTQMIAKGLDFPKVTLVGILQADGNLYSPDFRAPEKTFQLIMQVSGRSGRHDLPGKVVVQAFNPDHYAIRYAIQSDYEGFYQHEMNLRKFARYSPFYFVMEILLKGENVRDLFLTGREIIKELRHGLSSDAIVLGPTLPVVSRIRGKYRCQIILKYKTEDALSRILQEVRERYETESIQIQIDPFPTI